MANYGVKLRQIRKEKGIQQNDLARGLGIAQSLISDAERNSYPPLERLEAICKHLGIELWQFFLPADVVIPELAPDKAKWASLYDQIPDELLDVIIEIVRLVLLANQQGKTGQIVQGFGPPRDV